MRHLVLALAASVALSSPVFAAPKETPSASTAPIPAGAYTLDRSHSTLIFRVNHLGFSRFTASFSKFDAQLHFDPNRPERSRVTATVDPRSLTLPSPPAGFQQTLLGKDWLNAGAFPQIKFRTLKVVKTGDDSARITGELSLRGVKQSVVLNARFNGGYAGHPLDPRARIGFSAQGSFKRSAFGVSAGIPAPGTTMGVSDEVEVIIETEFNGPALATR
jgi:polyisoprenoid-binding protein YceI